jgi:hypothetical protein
MAEPDEGLHPDHDPDLTKNIGRLDPGAPQAQRPEEAPDEVWPLPNPGDAVAEGDEVRPHNELSS